MTGKLLSLSRLVLDVIFIVMDYNPFFIYKASIPIFTFHDIHISFSENILLPTLTNISNEVLILRMRIFQNFILILL